MNATHHKDPARPQTSVVWGQVSGWVSWVSWGSGDRDGGVVDHERRLEGRVLHTPEPDRDRLASEGREAERLLAVAGGLVQVRVGRQRGGRTRDDLHLERVERDGGGRLTGVDV